MNLCANWVKKAAPILLWGTRVLFVQYAFSFLCGEDFLAIWWPRREA